MGRKFHHLTYSDRLKIEALHMAKHTSQEIADQLGVHVSTINRELKRGVYIHRNTDWTEEERYSPEQAEEKYRIYLKKKGQEKKIRRDEKLLNLIEDKIIYERCSPYAALEKIKKEDYQGKVQICLTTCYNYIRAGEFPNLELAYLPYKRKKRKKKQEVRVKRAVRGTSIEKRPEEINERRSYGHWEMDTVCGQRGKSKKSLLVLTERMTRLELVRVLKQHTAEEVVRSLDRIERELGEKRFRETFKTITVDNGREFMDVEGMERSRRNKKPRTSIYYCHPYSSYERGSNENQNKLVRRHIPKGINFDGISKKEVKYIEDWINDYPRQMFIGKSAREIFERAGNKPIWKNSA